MNVYFVKGMPTLVPTSRLKPVVPTDLLMLEQKFYKNVLVSSIAIDWPEKTHF